MGNGNDTHTHMDPLATYLLLGYKLETCQCDAERASMQARYEIARTELADALLAYSRNQLDDSTLRMQSVSWFLDLGPEPE